MPSTTPAVPAAGVAAADPSSPATASDADAPFACFDPASTRPLGPLRPAIVAAYRRPEPEAVAPLLDDARLQPGPADAAQALAAGLARRLRERRHGLGREGWVQGLLQEFSLSSQEGVALMCLAEALLRIPDAATRDALIRDKIGDADWAAHLGRSESLFVNAAAWGLLVTGRLVATHHEDGLAGALARVVGKSGEPLIRAGVDRAMRLMGEQFVAGQTIGEALHRARKREQEGLFRHSYDMLGEAALTADDAARYLVAYQEAVHAIGRASAGRGIVEGPGLSIKLSALHPRYARAQADRVQAELYPRLLGLAVQARRYDIGLNIDAEEADRLDVSLDLLERLCFEEALAGWNGIGFVVQAYQKRCAAVLDFLIDLARRSGHRLMVRLVKGAYWDAEIKRAQIDGLPGYPVFTRKVHTDLSFLAGARRLLAAPDAVYPQFATHNAHTLAAVHEMAGGPEAPADRYEFQCLHGMGEPLYEGIVAPKTAGGWGRPCRIYAPVGSHETLLAYLVRRLLENGANTSFVNRIADPSVSIDELVADPVRTVERTAAEEGAVGLPHRSIPLPDELYGASRRNSAGIDLSDERCLADLAGVLAASAGEPWRAAPVVGGQTRIAAAPRPVRDPAHPADVVGHVHDATNADVADALAVAEAEGPAWARTPAADRAAALERAADALQDGLPRLLGLLIREAGKTAANAVAEVREAIDFLRYYAAQARRELRGDDATPPPPPLGTVVCISPWNFPLAIFCGQIAAALAAGNAVLAKPAEQTPLIAAEAVRLLHAAGVPGAALHLLPGPGQTVGAALVADTRVRGVLFTGSTAVARLLQKSLAGRLDAAGRPPVLIAETGGQNAMIVDSSALAEQVVIDALASAFDSAGQRCSALRVLCVQDDVARRVLALLRGAAAELRVGRPDRLSTDVGPVIDAEARDAIEAHVSAMAAKGRRVLRLGRVDGEGGVGAGGSNAGAAPDAALALAASALADAAGAVAAPPAAPLPSSNAAPAQTGKAESRASADAAIATLPGTFVRPTIIELDSLAELTREVFGPVLHVVRWRRGRLADLVDRIDATGYGLTLGLHTRIDETVDAVVRRAHAGNCYVNRNMVGAVVGVQPFGGEGLSGTGPKAGGPLYLRRLLAMPPATPPGGGPGAVPDTEDAAHHAARDRLASLAALRGLRDWVAAQPDGAALRAACDALAADAAAVHAFVLPGPTGERNTYVLRPRERVLCIADTRDDLLHAFATVLAAGARAVWPAGTPASSLHVVLPTALRGRVTLVPDAAKAAFDAVLLHGDADTVAAWSHTLADRDGPIVALHAAPRGARGAAAFAVERLLFERTLSVNTAAAGGNASLMTMGEGAQQP